MEQKTKIPIAVLISDVHYSLSTLSRADTAMRQAVVAANSLDVPLVVAGDLHDTKANMRGECIKAMIDTIKTAKMPPTIIVGNHDKINEKSSEHSLEFLRPYASIVDKPEKNLIPYWTMIPYQSDSEVLRGYLRTLKPNSNIIMHQGLQGANSGEYFRDHSALVPEDLAGHRVISGHYHTRASVKLPNNGVHDFIGNPYTLSFGEAKDPQKGFQVLYDDGSLEFVGVHLPRHVVVDYTGRGLLMKSFRDNDFVLLRVTATSDVLASIKKRELVLEMGIPNSFKLELIPTDTVEAIPDVDASFDSVIDGINAEPSRKARLKGLWKDLLEGAD